MTDDCNIFSLGILAEASASREATSPSGCILSLAVAPISFPPSLKPSSPPDEDQIQKKLALLADYLSGKSSSAAWQIWAGWQLASSFAEPPSSI